MAAPNIFLAKTTTPLAAGGSETTIGLTRLTTLTGEAITTSDFTIFNRGILTINPKGNGDSSYPEYVSFTGVDDANLAVTGVTRGLSAKSNSVVPANVRYHPPGTQVAITFGNHNIQNIIDYIDAEIATLTVGANQSVAAIAGEDVVAGEAVYLKDDGKWWLSRADQAATIFGVQLGVAQGVGAADGAISGGVIKLGTDTNQSSLTTGNTIYIGDTPGELSETPGTIERVVGVARNSTQVYFDPNYDHLLTSDQKDAAAGGGDFGTPGADNKFITEDYLGAIVDIQTFSTDGTWTKPSKGSVALIELWGGGSSGAAASDNDGSNVTAGGGGGGQYRRFMVALADLNATESVVIGSGGASVVASGSESNGNAGGATTFKGIAAGGGVGDAATGDNNASGASATSEPLFGEAGAAGGGSSTISADGGDDSIFSGPGGGGAGVWFNGTNQQEGDGGNATFSAAQGGTAAANGGDATASDGVKGGGGGAAVSITGTATSGKGGNGYARITVI